jgi:hypothetical protein
MSTSIYKVDYVCDCGINYGDCRAKESLILKSQNSVDVYILYRTDTHWREKEKSCDPVTSTEVPYCFGDAYLSALRKLLNLKESQVSGAELTEEQYKVVFG